MRKNSAIFILSLISATNAHAKDFSPAMLDCVVDVSLQYVVDVERGLHGKFGNALRNHCGEIIISEQKIHGEKATQAVVKNTIKQVEDWIAKNPASFEKIKRQGR